MATNRPQWQPLSMFPTLAPHIDGMLESAQEQYATLLAAKPKPYVLDNATVDRVISVYTTQRDDLGLFDEQLYRWGTEPKLTLVQSREITRLQQQMAMLRQVVTEILALTNELRKGTIEAIMNMDDAELGLRALLGDLPGQEQKRKRDD